jgi:hypothetical protein
MPAALAGVEHAFLLTGSTERTGEQNRRLSSGEFEHDLVHVAPAPVLTRFERADDRVARGVEVLRGVLVLRGVTAAHVPAGQAEPQVDPPVSHRQALLAAVRAGCNVFDLIKMRAV